MRHSAVPVAEASGSRVEQPRSAKLSAMRPTTSDLFEDQVEPSAPCLDAEPDDTMMVTQDEIQHAFSTQTSMHKSQTASVATFVPQRDDTLQHARQNVSNAAPLAPSKLSDPSALISSLLGRIGVRQEMVNGDPSSASSAALTPLLRAVIAQQRGMEMDSAPDFLPSRSPVTGSSETFPSKYGTSFARNAIHPSDLASSQPDLTGNFSNPCLSAAEVPTARFQTPSPQDTGFPSGDREIEPVLPSGMQIKNRFLGADSSLPEASVFSPLAVRTAPELPVFNPDTMEPPLSHFEEQNSTSARHLHDRAFSPVNGTQQQKRSDLAALQFPGACAPCGESDFDGEHRIREFLHANQSLGNPARLSFGPPPRGMPERQVSSGSSFHQMVREIHAAINKYKMQSQSSPDLPWPSMAGPKPGSDQQDFAKSDSCSLRGDAQGVARRVHFALPSTPPRFTSPTRPMRNAGGIEQPLTYPLANDLDDLQLELLDPGSSQYPGKIERAESSF